MWVIRVSIILSLYAVDAYQYDSIQAAKLITIAAWIRPIVAVLAGFISDRTNSIKMLMLSFTALLLANLYLHFQHHSPTLHGCLLLT